ncbi:carboxypeptidase regulatory-like domain-containing protein [Streptomyces sp. NPDC020917]|uniref:carboxypeptidase regulatory-like domain-containing protein n=1 Tax=Streptomyces sp. NPDC020917 TaxID=3365102 RepID=UPI00379AAF99
MTYRRSRGGRRLAVGLAAIALSVAGLTATVGATPAAAGSPPSPSPAAGPAVAPAAGPASGLDSGLRSADCAELSSAQVNAAVPSVRCFAVGHVDQAGRLLQSDAGPPATAMGPADLQSAYRLPDGGDGRTVAIVDAYGYSAAEADLAVFRSYYGLPACTTDNGCFTKVDERGGSAFPADNRGWTVEAALDLDAVSSVCPKCHIALVQADTASMDDMAAAEVTASHIPGVVAISNSFGLEGESPAETAYDQYFDHPGIAVTASSGDTGNLQAFPATSSTVLSVGGTRLTRDDSARGWHESAWGAAGAQSGAGSGCSQYEPAPPWQAGVDTTCGSRKATADISADADPVSGLGVYNTVGQSGWAQWGGTSLASPLVAGMYALAGTPTPGTYPASYPYATSSLMNDVTDGKNGACGTKLCEAGPGWDGPTGLGTPNGVDGLNQGLTGEVTGKVTDAASGAAVAGATVTATDATGRNFSTTAASDGSYDLRAPDGTYDVTAAAFGYGQKTTTGMRVVRGTTAHADFGLDVQDTAPVSGRVTDASGHGWPMRAKITVKGQPGVFAYSDPYTGAYSIPLPKGGAYTLQATSADLTAYEPAEVPVDLTTGTAPATDIGLTIDRNACTAPGYGWKYTGVHTGFEGWTGGDASDGWTVDTNSGNPRTWRFDNPGRQANLTGGSGNFAVVVYAKTTGANHTDLVSPVADLSTDADPAVSFDTDFVGLGDQVGTVDLSIDGGQTWKTVWTSPKDAETNGHVTVPIPAAAHQSHVRVRFHLGWSNYGWWWQLDNVLIGSRSCEETPGGLVAGVVRDDNTRAPVDGATVANADHPEDRGLSRTTPDDVHLSDGYYAFFSRPGGATNLDVTDGNYTPIHAKVDVPNDGVLHRNFDLKAGRLTIDRSTVELSARQGKTDKAKLTFSNDGTAPVRVLLGENDGGAAAPTGQRPTTAAPTMVVKTDTSAAGAAGSRQTPSQDNAVLLDQVAPQDAPWQQIANYPRATMDSAVTSYDGKVYVVGGSDGYVKYADVRVYDPGTSSWSALAPLPEALNGAAAGFVDGKLYVAGGWNNSGVASTHSYAYDPGSNTWGKVADLPGPHSAAGSAVVNGRLLVIGGCTTNECATASDAVVSYDPATDAWAQEPSYPSPVAYPACGGIGLESVCASGLNPGTGESLATTYTLVPGLGGWRREADLPTDDWGAAATVANGQLQVIGGVVSGGTAVTNQGYSYDPDADRWTALPNANSAFYRGGAACGLYQVGGASGGFTPVALAEVLPGYDRCDGGQDASWLSEDTTSFTVPPGHKVQVWLTADTAAVPAPGEYGAALTVATDTPYNQPPVKVALHVTAR